MLFSLWTRRCGIQRVRRTLASKRCVVQAPCEDVGCANESIHAIKCACNFIDELASDRHFDTSSALAHNTSKSATRGGGHLGAARCHPGGPSGGKQWFWFPRWPPRRPFRAMNSQVPISQLGPRMLRNRRFPAPRVPAGWTPGCSNWIPNSQVVRGGTHDRPRPTDSAH